MPSKCRVDQRSMCNPEIGDPTHCYTPKRGTCTAVIERQLEMVGALVILFDIETQIGGMGKLRAAL